MLFLLCIDVIVTIGNICVVFAEGENVCGPVMNLKQSQPLPSLIIVTEVGWFTISAI